NSDPQRTDRRQPRDRRDADLPRDLGGHGRRLLPLRDDRPPRRHRRRGARPPVPDRTLRRQHGHARRQGRAPQGRARRRRVGRDRVRLVRNGHVPVPGTGTWPKRRGLSSTVVRVETTNPWRILGLAVLAQFGVSVVDQGLPTLNGYVKAELGVSAAVAGLAVSSFAFGKIFGSYAAGLAAD